MHAPTRAAIIDMEGAGKVFRQGTVETHVLTDIHLRIAEGEFVAIGGPSGCGKTTLLSLLGLLDIPTHGRFRLLGEPVDGLGRAARARLRNRHIGFVFQAFNLIDDLSVADNVALPLTFRKDIAWRERTRLVAGALASVGMAHRMRHFPPQLSGGQQQRVAVARALVGNPSILLADEPTGNLDLRNGEIVMGLLAQQHAQGRTVCMVTHDDRFASMAERTIRLLDGRIVDESTFRQLRDESESGLGTLRAGELPW